MTEPQLLDDKELDRLEAILPGTKVKLVREFLEERKAYKSRTIQMYASEYSEQQHRNNFRYACLFVGLLLAAGSLALCAYMATLRLDISKLSAVIGAVGGVSAVLLARGAAKPVIGAVKSGLAKVKKVAPRNVKSAGVESGTS